MLSQNLILWITSLVSLGNCKVVPKGKILIYKLNATIKSEVVLTLFVYLDYTSTPDWKNAVTKSENFLAQLSLEDKAYIATGVAG